jgi:hypothetical protein
MHRSRALRPAFQLPVFGARRKRSQISLIAQARAPASTWSILKSSRKIGHCSGFQLFRETQPRRRYRVYCIVASGIPDSFSLGGQGQLDSRVNRHCMCSSNKRRRPRKCIHFASVHRNLSRLACKPFMFRIASLVETSGGSRIHSTHFLQIPKCVGPWNWQLGRP